MKLCLIKVIGGGGYQVFWVEISVLTYVIEGIIRILPLFTELQKLTLLLRYVSGVAKTAIFYSSAIF